MLLRPLVTQVVGIFILLNGLVANANIFGSDRRSNPSPVPANLRPIGVLRALPDDGSWGTAFLVGQCHILTAFHVAFPGHKKSGFVPSKKIKSRFYVGTNQVGGTSPRAFSSNALATPVSWGAFHTGTYSGLYGDWAILELDECLGGKFGTIEVSSRTANKTSGAFIHHAGYPQDRTTSIGIAYEKNCEIRNFGPGHLIGVDCAVLPGSSGGPILEKRNDKMYAIGIAIRENRFFDGILPFYQHSYRNIVLRADQFIQNLRRVLERPKIKSKT